jgi:hypothetical protein
MQVTGIFRVHSTEVSGGGGALTNMATLSRKKRRRWSFGDLWSVMLGLTVVGLWCDSYLWSDHQSKLINHGSCFVFDVKDTPLDTELGDPEESLEDLQDLEDVEDVSEMPVLGDPC